MNPEAWACAGATRPDGSYALPDAAVDTSGFLETRAKSHEYVQHAKAPTGTGLADNPKGLDSRQSWYTIGRWSTGLARLELATSHLAGERSFRLSYRPKAIEVEAGGFEPPTDCLMRATVAPSGLHGSGGRHAEDPPRHSACRLMFCLYCRTFLPYSGKRRCRACRRVIAQALVAQGATLGDTDVP